MIRQRDSNSGDSRAGTPRLTKQAGYGVAVLRSASPSHFRGQFRSSPLQLCLPLNAFNKLPTIFLVILLVVS